MTVAELMTGVVVNPSYTGAVMANDMVLAIDTSAGQDAAIANYAVVQEFIESIESSINAETNEKEYIRSGKSTTKKSNQRTFKVSGDKFIGDTAQDYFEQVKYATGQGAVVKYVYFNMLNGKGETGELTISVDTDAGGAAGENASITVSLSKVGAAPAPYTWTSSATTYAVTLVANGGTITSGDISSYTYGTGATLPDADDITAPSGKEFAGWYDNSHFTGEAITAISTTDSGDKTFYAKWDNET